MAVSGAFTGHRHASHATMQGSVSCGQLILLRRVTHRDPGINTICSDTYLHAFRFSTALALSECSGDTVLGMLRALLFYKRSVVECAQSPDC